MLFVIITYPQTMGTTVGPVTVKHISVVLLTPDSVEFKFGLENTQQSEYT